MGLLKRTLQHFGTVISPFPTFQEEINASYPIQHMQLLSTATRKHDHFIFIETACKNMLYIQQGEAYIYIYLQNKHSKEKNK